MFLAHFEKQKDIELDDPFKELIADISLYIKEMRVLKNILNEFDIIRNKLNREELKPLKLFAFIVYKNICPDDFAKLYIDASFINDIFFRKNRWKQVLIDDKLQKVNALKDKIQKKKSLALKNIRELRLLYLGKYYEIASNTNRPIAGLYLNGQAYSKSEMTSDECFNLFRNQKDIYFSFNLSYNNHVQTTGISFQQIEEEIDTEQSYIEKERLLSNNSESIQIEINKLNVLIEDIEQWDLYELLTEDSVRMELNKLKLPPVLAYLLKNNHINENYTSYISFFVEGNLQKTDSDFIHSIKEQSAKPFNHDLINPENIIIKIWPREFKNPEVLNIHLVDYLIDNDTKSNREKFEILLQQLTEGDHHSLKFINSYIEHGKQPGLLVKYLIPYFDDFWEKVLIRSEFPQKSKDEIFELMLGYISTKEIIKQNKKDSISQYIKNRPDFINYYEKSNLIQQVKDLIKELNVKFRKLDPYNSNEHLLFNFIDEYCLYAINIRMVRYILIGYEANLDKFDTANYTCISSSNAEMLNEYITMNINEYVENIHFRLESSIHEKPEHLNYLFNNKNLLKEHKYFLIEKCEFKCNLEKVPPELWSKLFEQNKVKAIWENIIAITQEHEIYHKPIIKFLNNLKNMDCLLNSIPEVPSDDYIGLFKSILTSNNLEDNIHKAYSEKLNVKITEEEKETINKEKAYNLIKNHRLVYSFEMYEGFKKGYDNDVHLKFIVEYIEEYINNYKDDILKVEDYTNLIDMLPNDNNKESFIDQIPNNTIQTSIELSNLIRDYYLTNKISNISYDRFFTLADKNTDNNKLLELFNLVIDRYDLRQTNLLLNILPRPWNTILMRRQIKVENTAINLKTFESLVRKGIISSFKPKGEHYIGYIKTSNIFNNNN